MGSRKDKIIQRKRTIKKSLHVDLVINPEQDERKIELLICIILFLFGFYQSILFYGHHIMPSPDFPSFLKVGKQLWSFKIPTDYMRGPTYGLFVYPLSLIVGGGHPELTAAWLFNSILQIFNLILIFLVGKKIVGNSAFWLALLGILNPWLIEVFTKPIAEICLLFFMLTTFFFMFRGSSLCYLFASIATMVRYECAALILASFVMDMIRRKDRKEKIRALCFSVLASLPLGLWMLGTMFFFPNEKSGTVHYIQFINIEKLINIKVVARELNLLWYSIIGPLFRPGLSAGENSVKLLNGIIELIAFLSFAFGIIWGLLKKQWNILALLIFFVLYMIVHISYAYSEPRFYTPVQWIFLLICWYGIKSFWQRIKAYEKIPKYVIFGAQTAVLVISILWLSILAGYLPRFANMSPRSVSLPYAAIIASVFFVAGGAFIYKGKNLWRNIVVLAVICLMIISNQFSVAGVIKDGTHDGEFKQLLDWYIHNAKPGEKMVSTLNDLLGVLAPAYKDCFISHGSLNADNPDDFVNRCYENGVKYVAWDSRIGVTPDDVFYTLAKLDNIAVLCNKQSIGPYEYITTITHPTDDWRYINVFRLRPRPVQPSVQSTE
ncbi:MAG: hypothetical protein JW787_09730 [Sedimentisphaerales bacterium]|nr:hypothetical protein [Sedimentisphaerales bacterium]